MKKLTRTKRSKRLRQRENRSLSIFRSIEEEDEDEAVEAIEDTEVSPVEEPPELPATGEEDLLEDIDGILDLAEAEPAPGEPMLEFSEPADGPEEIDRSTPPPPPVQHSEEDLVDEVLAVTGDAPPEELEEWFDSEGETLDYHAEGSMDSGEYEASVEQSFETASQKTTSEMTMLDDSGSQPIVELSQDEKPSGVEAFDGLDDSNDWLGSSDAEEEDREIDPDLPDADLDEQWLLDAEKELNEGLNDDDLEETFESSRVETKDMALELPDFDSEPSGISMDLMQSDPSSMKTLLHLVHKLEDKVEMPPEEFIFDLVHGTLPAPDQPDDAALHEEVSSTMRTMIQNNQIIRQELLQEFFKQR